VEPCIKNAVAGGWQPGEERTGKSVELEGSKTERRDDVMVKFEKSERKTRKNLRLEILSGLCFLWLELNSNSRFAISPPPDVGHGKSEANGPRPRTCLKRVSDRRSVAGLGGWST
jgi:hypothetical protein